jgi:hypothetical protein
MRPLQGICPTVPLSIGAALRGESLRFATAATGGLLLPLPWGERIKRYEEALQYYNKSLEIAREIGDKIVEELSLAGIKRLKEKMDKKKAK